MKRQTIIRFFASLILPLLAGAMTARADIDKKFYKKAAEKVWGMDLPQFNPSADLSDSLFKDQSAVFIACYIGMDADYLNDLNPTKESTFGISNSNITQAVFIRRNMVKLNDAAAVEDFTEFSVDAPESEKYRGYTLLEMKPAFGARIIKPDGTTKEVDMDEALTVTTGKKNKDSEYKIAIPGLMPGDILDYFFYTYYSFDELSIPSFTVSLLKRYPTRNFMLDCRVAPELALEYGAYNGAPKLTTFNKIDDKNQLYLELENVDLLDDRMPYFSVARQMPFMDIHILNNTARLEEICETARPGGIRHTSYPFLMSDIAASIVKCEANTKIMNEAAGIVKNWKNAHAEATDRQIADAAWLALKIALLKNDFSISDRQLAVTFSKLLEKIGMRDQGRVGVTASRSNVPVTELVNHNDATYVVFVGDVCYIASNNLTILPGEIPARYDGEAFVMFDAKPDNPLLKTAAVPGTLPHTKSKDNSLTTVTTVALDPDNEENLSVSSDIKATGATKQLLSLILPSFGQINALTAYLGVKPFKPGKDFDAAEEEKTGTEIAKELISQLWNTDDGVLSGYEILEYGCTPDSANIRMRINGTVPGAISQGGNNLMVDIGHFVGREQQIKGKQRERDISIVRDYPDKFDTTIIFEIPEGYAIDENSLSDLNRSVTTAEASFNSEAHTDGRTVTVRIVERHNRSLYATSSWPSILKVSDAAFDFNSASIILRPL